MISIDFFYRDSMDRLYYLLISFLFSLSALFSAWIGDPDLPPHLNPADLLLYESFEKDDHLFIGELNQSVIIDTDAAVGKRCLWHHNSDAGKYSFYVKLPESLDSAYARYLIKVLEPQKWQDAGGNPYYGEHYKMMGFVGGSQDCKGGTPVSDSCLCFEMRSRFNNPWIGWRSENYYGILSENLDQTINIVDGKWHVWEYLVKLNDPGQANGYVKLWVDGHETFWPNLQIRGCSALKMDQWWFTYWSNDNWLAPLEIDDIIASKTKIGPPTGSLNLAPQERIPDTAPRLWISPNPFQTQIKISVFIPYSAVVQLAIDDLAGRRIRTIMNRTARSGESTCFWNAENGLSQQIPAGIYFARLMMDGTVVKELKILFLK